MNYEMMEYLFTRKIHTIGNRWYAFEAPNKLTITEKERVPIEGTFSFTVRDGTGYLKTDPQIFEGKDEISVEVILNEDTLMKWEGI